jgi:hypothetical protein
MVHQKSHKKYNFMEIAKLSKASTIDLRSMIYMHVCSIPFQSSSEKKQQLSVA